MKALQYMSENVNKLYGKYIGEIINDEDPKQRGRVQVNIHGITDRVDNKNNFPWAEQEASISRGTDSVVGISSVPTKGTLVYIEFLYGSPSHPIYTGIVRGASDSSPKAKADYPNVTVIHTDDGQTIEYGSGYIKLTSSGGASIELNGNTVAILSDVLTHNGVNIGSTHTHGGVSIGVEDSDVPN